MCRNIKTLFNFEPPVDESEIQAASLQYVRKICGFTQPSALNQDAFDRAVGDVAAASRRVLHALETSAAPKNRETEGLKAKARALKRFGP